jgi:hypothetical protein
MGFELDLRTAFVHGAALAVMGIHLRMCVIHFAALATLHIY